MGWCHEFGPQIRAGCAHPMTAGATECHCNVCGVQCDGRFKGCKHVWERGARTVTIVASAERPRTTVPAPVDTVDEQVSRPPMSSRGGTDDVLHGVATALETVGAELRAMRSAVTAVQEAVVGPSPPRQSGEPGMKIPVNGQDPPDRGSTFH